MTRRVVITRNLMDASKFKALPIDVVVTASAAPDALSEADLVILDLATGIDPGSVVGENRRVVAYGSHVEVDVMEQARAVGCSEVVPRSKMFRDLASWMA